MALQQNQVKDIIATALIKAWEDENFKEKLMAAPIAIIERLTGERLSFNKGVKTPVLELTKSDTFEFTPSYIDIIGEELTDQELEMIAGGGIPDFESQEGFVSFLESYL